MKQILNKAIEHYGAEHQLIIAFEEMAELQKELCKNMRGNLNREHILEELADCLIMFDQILIMYDINEAELIKQIEKKVRRLEKRIEAENG